MKYVHFFAIFCTIVAQAMSNDNDITNAVFGNVIDGMPAAFGDFNSDELTDVFVLSENKNTLKIMLASNEEPLLRPHQPFSCNYTNQITSVVPGDFDGDVFMDILITIFVKGPTPETSLTHAHILWGGNGKLNCSVESQPMIEMQGQPLAIDYNQDMIIDLFGTSADGKRTFWVFNSERTKPVAIQMEKPLGLKELLPIKTPHSNAFLDLNNDYYPDLFLTVYDPKLEKSPYFEVWNGKDDGFDFSHMIPIDFFADSKNMILGQALFLDVELKGRMDLVLPVCFDIVCKNSTIMIYSNGWHNLLLDLKDTQNMIWSFPSTIAGGLLYTNTITLHGGDFNMDGYPDLLATLQVGVTPGSTQSFLLENVKCDNCVSFNRTFDVRWNALSPFNKNQTVLAVFYDFYQDGILDVILVKRSDTNKYTTAAFKNSLDYDANFVKVMVLTGRTNSQYPISPGSLGQKKRTYGTNFPGPTIAYKTTTQDGDPRNAIAVQLPQSAHFSLNLPFTTFGLGRTPNFIDSINIGLANRSREWPQIIPNSQMVVIPNPITDPSRWKVQLFVTPSKLILLSAAALTATCGLIIIIIGILYWKERREDKIEKLQEAHRFHFDAM